MEKEQKIKEIDFFIKSNLEKIENENCQTGLKLIVNLILNSVINLSNKSEENKRIALDFFKKYGEAYEDVLSSIENIHCSCRHRFGNFISKNIKEYIKVIDLLLYMKKENNLDEIYEIKNQCEKRILQPPAE